MQTHTPNRSFMEVFFIFPMDVLGNMNRANPDVN